MFVSVVYAGAVFPKCADDFGVSVPRCCEQNRSAIFVSNVEKIWAFIFEASCVVYFIVCASGIDEVLNKT